MHTLVTLLSVFVAIFLLVSWIASRPRGHQLSALVNIAEGFQPAKKTYLTDAAVAQRYLLAKHGTDASHAGICGVGDIPLGIYTDEATAAEEGVNVDKFGLSDEGKLGIASGAIAVGEYLVPGAAGTVRKLPTAAGTYYIIGRATSAAADTEKVEYTPSFPIQRVVP
jgi:hypothetical protein